MPEQNEIKALEQESSAVVKQAREYNIATQEEYATAGTWLKDVVKELKKEIQDTFDPIVASAHETHKKATTKRKEHLAPVEEAERIVKNKMLAYYQEQKRKEAEAQRKADEEARKAEVKRKKELEEQAQRHEEKGNTEKAEERREMVEDVHVDTQIVAPRVEKIAGIQVRENWDYEITGKAVLIEAIMKNAMLSHLVTVDEKELRKTVKLYKEKLNLPGLKVFNRGSIGA